MGRGLVHARRWVGAAGAGIRLAGGGEKGGRHLSALCPWPSVGGRHLCALSPAQDRGGGPLGHQLGDFPALQQQRGGGLEPGPLGTFTCIVAQVRQGRGEGRQHEACGWVPRREGWAEQGCWPVSRLGKVLKQYCTQSHGSLACLGLSFSTDKKMGKPGNREEPRSPGALPQAWEASGMSRGLWPPAPAGTGGAR